MEKINLETATTKELVEFYNAHADKPVKRFSTKAAGQRRVAALIETLEPQPDAAAQSRSAGVAKSWKDKEVHAKRCQRSAVLVDGVEFPSVAAAFRELGLPYKQRITFRMSLKETGTTKAYDRTWKIVPLNY